MKKCIFLLFLLLLGINLFANEAKINVRINSPRIIKSNSKELIVINISNDDNITFNNLELSIISNEKFEINLDRTIINVIEPKEVVNINMEIINNNSYYFTEEIYITIKLSSNEFSKDNNFKFTINPVEHFWFFVIISVALVIIIFFSIIFVRMNKGE